MARIKRELDKESGNPGSINNPEGLGGKSGKIKDCQVDNINLTKSSKGGTKSDYLLARIKRDAPEIAKDCQVDNVNLTKKDPKGGNKTLDNVKPFSGGNQSDYLIAHTELGKDNQVDNINLIKDCQTDNVSLTKDSKHGNKTMANVSNGIINQEESLQCKDSKHGNKAVKIPYHNQSLMNFLKKSQENIATPACQTDNYPTNTRILYKNTNTRLTLPHQLKNPTYELPNNITNTLSYLTHTYKYITDRSPYHHIYYISDASYKYNPSYITGPNMEIILQA